MRASHIKAVRMPGWHVVYSSENYEVSPEPSEPQDQHIISQRKWRKPVVGAGGAVGWANSAAV